ncbi:MAG: hypothetical protein ACREBR_01105, partial [bacterium]
MRAISKTTNTGSLARGVIEEESFMRLLKSLYCTSASTRNSNIEANWGDAIFHQYFSLTETLNKLFAAPKTTHITQKHRHRKARLTQNASIVNKLLHRY